MIPFSIFSVLKVKVLPKSRSRKIIGTIFITRNRGFGRKGPFNVGPSTRIHWYHIPFKYNIKKQRNLTQENDMGFLQYNTQFKKKNAFIDTCPNDHACIEGPCIWRYICTKVAWFSHRGETWSMVFSSIMTGGGY